MSARIRTAVAEASTPPASTKASSHARTSDRACPAAFRMCSTFPERRVSASTLGCSQSEGRPGHACHIRSQSVVFFGSLSKRGCTRSSEGTRRTPS
jgi:hypothetical protein